MVDHQRGGAVVAAGAAQVGRPLALGEHPQVVRQQVQLLVDAEPGVEEGELLAAAQGSREDLGDAAPGQDVDALVDATCRRRGRVGDGHEHRDPELTAPAAHAESVGADVEELVGGHRAERSAHRMRRGYDAAP